MKRVLTVLFFLSFGFFLYAQSAEIFVKDSASEKHYAKDNPTFTEIKCIVTGYDKENVFYKLENDSVTHSILKSDVEKITFAYSDMTFTDDGEMIFKGRFLPGSKWSVSDVNYGKYTLHGKPYKGPVVHNNINGIDYAGTSWSDLKGVLVPIE